jgi:sugar/nucleoside kinase (ribokinase family)
VVKDIADARTGMTFDVLLHGSPFCDLTFTFTDRESLPVLGQEVYASNFAINPGGIFNISSALSRLGLRVGLKAQLGTDIFSRFIAERMEGSGLSLELIRWIERPKPVITAGVSFPHDRLFISYAPPQDEPPLDQAITTADFDRYRPRVLFTYGDEGVEVFREARRRGILVYLDTSWGPDHLRSAYMREVLGEVDVAAPNLLEALEITGASDPEGALDLLSRWCPCVVMKLGALGCIAVCRGQRYRVPAIDVRAVETTGAGDNFNAGLIYGLLRGYPFERSLRCATITGGLSTLTLGGSAADYTAETVEEMLEAEERELAERRGR